MKRIFRRFFRLFFFGVFVLLLIMGFNTLRFSSKQVPIDSIEPLKINNQVAEKLSKLVQVPTLTYEDRIDTSSFLELDTLISDLFPLVDSFLTKKTINYSTLFQWKGKNNHLKPILLIAHKDIVPIVDPDAWQVPPLSGIIKDGYVWGRGTLDDKNSIAALLESIEILLSEGYSPERTIYLGFGHDEEVGGINGAQAIVSYFEQEGVQFEYVLDEGLVVLEEALPMLAPPLAMIGIAEKGYISFQLTSNLSGGHTMMPPAETAIGVLSKGISKLQENPFPARINGAARSLFEYAGPEMSLLYKVIFANLWLTEGLLTNQLSKEATSNAVIRTTLAPTIISGGIKDNILPTQAKATINFRILPGESIESVQAYIEKVVDDDRITVSSVSATFQNNPSPVSDTEVFGFKVIQRTIQEIFPGVVVAPGLVIAGTDSRHYFPVCKNIYRFMPVQIKKEELSGIHGSNERISLDNYKQMIRFYRQLILNSCK